MYVMLKEIFISSYEFVPAAQISSVRQFSRVFGVCSLLLVVYLLSSKMTTEQIDFLEGALKHKECEHSTWRMIALGSMPIAPYDLS